MSDNDFITKPDINISLPSVLPTGRVTVDDERFTYLANDTDTDTIEQKEYVLDKAPVKRIERVTGVYDGRAITFDAGVDYELSADNERIVWQNNKTPDIDSYFYVTYTAQSVLGRYNAAAEEELDDVSHILAESIESKFVDHASGDELDKLGKLFGDVGKRRNRTDTQYKIYLKSIFRSLRSRGTVDDIKSAVSAATGVPESDITINEDFTNNEYEIVVTPNTNVRGSTIEEIAQVADPSGVNQIRTRFRIDPDEAGIDDSTSLTEGLQQLDEFGVSDSVANFGFATEGAVFDDIIADDVIVIDPNQTITSDKLFVDDAKQINPNKNSTSDSLSVDDDATTSPSTTTSDGLTTDDDILSIEPSHKNAHKWEPDNEADTTEWGFFEWTELRDVTSTAVDTGGSDDAVTNVTTASVAWGTNWETFDWAGAVGDAS